jgi:hypothetical protein
MTSVDSAVFVFGATAPGILVAVRAAREGLTVNLVATSPHLGGSLPSLGAIETHYEGNRAPLLQEFIGRVRDHYATTFGRDSEAFRTCTGGGRVTGGMCTFEPKVGAMVLEQMVEAEARIRVWRDYRLEEVETEGRMVRAVTVRSNREGGSVRFVARSFVEATYEGDFMARAGASYRVGREGRNEFGEPSAGRVFTRWVNGRFPRAAVEGRLNLTVKGATTEGPLPGSTGEGDTNIQSYSYRLCLTDDPSNRRMLDAPPPGYDRARFEPILLTPAEKERLALPFHHRFLVHSLREMADGDHLFHGHVLPNRKRSWNATNLTGGGKGYPEGDAPTREAIARCHLEHALGLLWFLQNDPEMPHDLRARAREWGLARDEFADNDNIPPQLYIREARRLVGRHVFTEHDALIAPGLERAPIHSTSIGITDFSLDSLACTMDRMPGSLCDGQLFQMEVSRPAQVPYGVLLPRELDNLLVVSTMSATHVGWGAIRQTPTLMHLAESAAWAIIIAHREQVAPATIDISNLQAVLVEMGVMISFFNDFDMSAGEASWVPAIQFLGTRGFFGSYDARPQDPLTAEVAAVWLEAIAGNATTTDERARRVRHRELTGVSPCRGDHFAQEIRHLDSAPIQPAANGTLSRATASEWCYRTILPRGNGCQ